MSLTLEAIDYGGGINGNVGVSLSNITSTAGRLLVLDVAGSSTSAAWTAILSDGWTLADGAISGSMAGAQFYRIDSGSYTGISVDIGSGSMLATIRQYSGNATSGVLDDSAVDDTNSGSASITCYSGSATSIADGAAVSAHFWRDNRFVDSFGGPSLNSGFWLEDYVKPENHGFNTAHPGISLGFKSYTGSASHSVTAITSDTGDENIGVIGLYKATGGGYTHPTLSAAAMGSLTSTGGIPQVHYSFA